MNRKTRGRCPVCGGSKRSGTTTFTAELGFGVVVVRDVPASVCNQCGADWISDRAAARIEKIVDEAREKRLLVEVRALG